MKCAALAVLCFLSAPALAQNGSNYHVLNNGAEAVFTGIGAGGTQTTADGLGTWIPGEDLRGSLLADPDGSGLQFCYRMLAITEQLCIFGPGTSGSTELRFPGIYLIEFDGLNPNAPAVFTQPVCTPLTASFVPYGLGPGSSVSFVTTPISDLGPTHTLLLPDNGLIAGTGNAQLIGAVSAALTLPSAGCYVVQFGWVPSTLAIRDGIDGLWHYAVNSDDGNQYWQMSTDEMNLWQSNTVATDADVTGIQTFFSVFDYGLLLVSSEANTHAALAPHGLEQSGPYYHQTENMVHGGAPNFGFDIGRGSHAVSFSGLGGVKVPASLGGHGNGAQDPAYGSGSTVPTIGFVTWDNKPNQSAAGVGSQRVTWVSVDLAQIYRRPPTAGVTEAGGSVRLPVEVAGYPQALTQRLLSRFVHTTAFAPSGWPDPLGIGFSFTLEVAGGSAQMPLANLVSQVPCNVGLAMDVQYGSSGKDPNNLDELTFDPQLADISGRKELFLIP